MPRGGKRPGAGRKKGYKEAQTLEKEEARALLRRLVTQQMGPLVEAQLDNAKGLRHLMWRDPKTGKFVRVEDADTMDKLLASDGETYWIYTKDPSIQAFTDLMNRTIDKPMEHVTAEVDGTLEIAWKEQ